MLKFILSRWFLFFIFPLSVLIDLLNGYVQYVMGIRLPLGIIYRSLILFLMLYCVPALRDRWYKGYLLGLLVLLCLSLLFWGMFSDISYRVELENIVRVAYILLAIAMFKIIGSHVSKNVLVRAVADYGFLIAIPICISYLTGWGQYSYGDNYGFGTKSFFVAGNDLTLTLFSSSLFASCALFSHLNCYRSLRLSVILIACVLIGTRTGTVGAVMVFVITVMYYLFVFKDQKWRKALVLVFMIPLVSCVVYVFGSYVYSSYDEYALSKYEFDNIITARDFLIDGAKKHISEFDGMTCFVGEGAYALFSSVAQVSGEGEGQRVVEADFYEIIGSYGYLLGGAIMFPFCFYALGAVNVWLRERNYLVFCMMVLLVSFIIVSFLAGHAIKNVMFASVYGIAVSLLFNKVEWKELRTLK